MDLELGKKLMRKALNCQSEGMWLYVVTLLNCTHKLEWYMARLVVKNGQPKNTSNDEIRLCAQNKLIVLGVDTIQREYVITSRERESTL
jgi:hypothetical protein